MKQAVEKYFAFVSYSHSDTKIASRLHRKLESYRQPRSRATGADGPRRLGKVFRDREELGSSASLTDSIEKALDDSAALIVVCSPDAAASRWVNEEIFYFRSRHPDRAVLAFVVRGDPSADLRAPGNESPFPLNLLLADLDQPEGELLEPLAADARKVADGFSPALLKLVAGLLDVSYDSLRHRELLRRHKKWALAGTAALSLAVVFAVLAWQATVARNEARSARAQAELELISERQTRNFLLSVFKLANPGEARGNSVTVREVLDTAVARIDSTEFAQPVIKSRFLATMGQAYSSLGMNRKSIDLLERSLAALPASDTSIESSEQKLNSQLELADVLVTMGEYDRALDLLDSILQDVSTAELSPGQQAYRNNIRGDILSYTEHDAEAMEAYQEALIQLGSAGLTREQEASARSRSLGGIAILNHFSGHYGLSQQYYAEAVNILMPVYGEMHPDTIWAMISWGSSAYSAGDTQTARKAWERSLKAAKRVFDETHPELGTINNNLGRLLLETGDDVEAEALLREALAIDRLHNSATFDDLAYPLYNLATTRLSQGDYTEARALLEEALLIAEAAGHRMLGPILNSLGDILCQDGDPGEGMQLLSNAIRVNSETHGTDDWRTHRSKLALSWCRQIAGEDVSTESMRADACFVMGHWANENYFTVRAREQSRGSDCEKDLAVIVAE